MSAVSFKCAVCGDPAVSIGYGDGDFLCEVCSDWRQESVDAEQKKRQAIMNSTEWVAAWMSALPGYGGEAPPIPRKVWP
jgi:hypothetical protein